MLTEVDDKQLIAITPEWMEQKFDEMNKLLFNGLLPKCRFSLFTTGRGSRGGTLGWFKTRRDYHVSAKFIPWSSFYRCSGWQYSIDGEESMEPSDFAYYMNPLIQLNGNYNWTEKAALSTLVHEMCHYRQHVFGFYEGTQQKIIHHGVTFQRIAEDVSAKSNEFFTVERIAKAEQMEQMDLTDTMKAFNDKRAAKGIRFFKIELTNPEYGRRSGNYYKFAYAIPASTISDDYLANIRASYKPDRYKRVIECFTTDGNIKRYHTVKSIGSWYYSNAKSIEEVLPDVRVDKENEISFGSQFEIDDMYIFRMKYKEPCRQKGGVYYWAYKIVKPVNFSVVKNYIMNEKSRYTYADYCTTNDGGILSHKDMSIKKMGVNYLSYSENVLPSIRKNEWEVLFNNQGFENKQQSSLSNFLYGSEGNPHLNYQQQQQKRYSFTIKTMKNGVPDIFIIKNATEQEAKQQMKQRFPGWSDETIDDKFKKYTNSMVGENISRNELQQIVEQVVEQLVQEQIAPSGT